MAGRRGAERGGLPKGDQAEECLRRYFLSSGYFVVRGAKFRYSGLDVTDVDLWLYLRGGPVSRERCIVDVKNKKTPQVLERVFWVKGLKEVLGVEQCIVVTTDNREEPRAFGTRHRVTVLHGEFLQRVGRTYRDPGGRLSEGEFVQSLRTACITDGNVVWTRLYDDAKGLVLGSIGFNACNRLLGHVRRALEDYVASSGGSVAATRLLYAFTGLFLVALDYRLGPVAPLEARSREQALVDGFRYGDAGKARAQEVVDRALSLAAATSSANLFSRRGMEAEIEKQLTDYPAEVLAEFFAKTEVLRSLFCVARRFEAAAFASALVPPGELPPELKSVIGLLCDCWGLDRRTVL